METNLIAYVFIVVDEIESGIELVKYDEAVKYKFKYPKNYSVNVVSFPLLNIICSKAILILRVSKWNKINNKKYVI